MPLPARRAPSPFGVPVKSPGLLRALTILAVTAILAAGCGGGASTPTAVVPSRPVAFPPPDISAFLREPVATPTACPPHQLGSASGLSSPWVGHVDISVFIDTSATTKQIATLGARIKRAPDIAKVYFEPQAEAYQEFQRLYTCSAEVPKSQTPASYRIALEPTTRIDARNALVARFARLPGVDSVSCDPSLPCVNVVRSATPSS